MRRALPFAFVALMVTVVGALIGASAAAPRQAATGTVSFSGRIVDPGTPLAPGMVVTVRLVVVARNAGCVETRIDTPQPTRNSKLWLCAGAAQGGLPAVGESVNARARITRTRVGVDGVAPVSDSFVLLGAG